MPSPFAALVAPQRPPAWYGPRLVHLLDDTGYTRSRIEREAVKPKPLPPWLLLTPQLEAEMSAGVWDLSDLWPFPDAKKHCPKCDRDLPLADFYRRDEIPRSYCKACCCAAVTAAKRKARA